VFPIRSNIPNMPPPNRLPNKDNCIDFMLLHQCSSYTDDNYLELWYEYDSCTKHHDNTTQFNLRQVMRRMGYKITKIHHLIDSNFQLKCCTITTNIPRTVYEYISKCYSDYLCDIYDEDMLSDSDSDESESELSDTGSEPSDDPSD
jgi:hypothetical protein